MAISLEACGRHGHLNASHIALSPSHSPRGSDDLCAISLPLPRAGALRVGLMLVARNGHDRRLFRIAAAVERLFSA